MTDHPEREDHEFVAEDPRMASEARSEAELSEDGRPDLLWAGAIGLALSRESIDEIASRDAEWASFASRVASRIEALEEPPVAAEVVGALRSELDRAIGAESWATFTSAVLARVEAEISAELDRPSDVGALVRGDAERAVAEREGQWDQFNEDVGAAETEQLRQEVRSELAAMETGFGGPFRAQVERRIRSQRPAREARPAHHARRRFAPLLIAAVAAALAFFVLPPKQIDPTSELPIARGVVSIDEVNFEGQVTITQENGVAVLWLPGAS